MHQIPSITFCAIKINSSLSDLPPIEIIQILFLKKSTQGQKNYIGGCTIHIFNFME